MFADRFEGSTKHGSNRERLYFTEELTHLGPIKDEWAFIENETLRSNIASGLQKVHFDILLVNKYNVYYSPEAMTMKHAIITAASVAEAVLEVAVKMIEDDTRVAAIIETRERVFDEMYTLQLREFAVPDGTRVVAGVQREVVRSKLDRNTKMDLLIRAARAGEIVDEEMEKKLQQLRRLRNRVHIKTVEELEYAWYTPQVANATLDILEEFRLDSKAWIEARRPRGLVDALVQRVAPPASEAEPDDDIDWDVPVVASYEDIDFGPPTPSLASPAALVVDDLVEHNTLGSGVVVGAEPGGVVAVRFFGDGSVRRLMVPYAPMRKIGVFAAADDNLA